MKTVSSTHSSVEMMVSGKLAISKQSLNLKLMLEGGQCFRWHKSSENQWTGVASKVLWVLSQHDDHVQYHAKSKEKITPSFCHQFLTKYLRLDENLESLYKLWSQADSHFASVAGKNAGLRILNQDPVENVFSFICSSNNNISRISSMVEKMCKLYGEVVAEEKDASHHAFPTLERLAGEGVEQALRTAGFGYRAKYIHKSAERLVSLGGEEWLANLTKSSYSEAKQQLLQLEGVGPKVADCICLMSLGHLCAVPVDTHVFQIAAEHYMPHLKSSKSCTPKNYIDINNHFLELYGPYAGWAHTILFCADLKMFKEDDGKPKNRKKSAKRHSSKLSCVEGLSNGNSEKIVKRRKQSSNVNLSSQENVTTFISKTARNETDSNGSRKDGTRGRLRRVCKM